MQFDLLCCEIFGRRSGVVFAVGLPSRSDEKVQVCRVIYFVDITVVLVNDMRKRCGRTIAVEGFVPIGDQ